uniref:BHLH domain-containing protein n=1 Tax=Kalanchoe fedtschenkoi TaxID=63787 RepID=A0A7N0T6C6_KALFE
RRSKINERFQRLRDLIPISEQKRDTASFLLEVIDYVQYLQGEVQKYEGPYQPWSAEPTKLMPWRNNHWRTQSIAPQPLGNGVEAGYAPKFNDASQTPLLGHPHEFNESDALSDPSGRAMDQHPDLASSAMAMQTLAHHSQNDRLLSHQLQRPLSDAQSADPSLAAGTFSQPDGLMIEAGTISISSAYSQGLLNTLTDALQRAGVDLSQANISVRIDLGKRANRGPAALEDYSNLPSTHPPPSSSGGEDLEQAQKRLKTQRSREVQN